MLHYYLKLLNFMIQIQQLQMFFSINLFVLKKQIHQIYFHLDHCLIFKIHSLDLHYNCNIYITYKILSLFVGKEFYSNADYYLKNEVDFTIDFSLLTLLKLLALK